MSLRLFSVTQWRVWAFGVAFSFGEPCDDRDQWGAALTVGPFHVGFSFETPSTVGRADSVAPPQDPHGASLP